MEDEIILMLLWEREERGIQELADKYGAYCTAVAANILKTPEDREECVNDTYLRAWNSIPPARPGNLRMYLARITRNLAYDRCKAAAAQKRSDEMTLVLDELAECVISPNTPEATLSHKELGQAINRFVKALPHREGNVFVRRYFFAESTCSIAQRYAMTPGNVKVILSRTRKKLREYLIKEDYIDG